MAKAKKIIPEVKTKHNQYQNVEDIEITNGKFKIYLTEKYASIQLLGDILVGFFFVFGSLLNIFGAPEVIGNSSYLIGSLALTVRPILKIIRRTWIYNEKRDQEEKLSSENRSEPGDVNYERVKEQAIHINGEFSEDVDEAFTDRNEVIDDGGMEVTKSGAHFVSDAVGEEKNLSVDDERSIDERFKKDAQTKTANDQDAQIHTNSSKTSQEQSDEAEQSASPSEGGEQGDKQSDDENADRGFYHHDTSEDNDEKPNEDEQPLSLDVEKRKEDS